MTEASFPPLRLVKVKNPGAARNSRAFDPGDSPRPGQAQFGTIPGILPGTRDYMVDPPREPTGMSNPAPKFVSWSTCW